LIELSGIYKITCLKTNKIYIGSSIHIDGRWNRHKHDLRKKIHPNLLLQNAWNKYGEKNFEFEVIETVDNIRDLLTKEKEWIDTTKCYKKEIGFNISVNPLSPNLGKFIDLTGQKFGRLTVIEYMGSNRYRVSMWLCKCDCGKEKTIHGGHLKDGSIKSCGCLKRECGGAFKHGHSRIGERSITYQRWQNMIDKCSNLNNISYENYNKIKIKICYRWSNKNPRGFENFLKDMGECPGKEYSIGRINKNKGHNKKNCYWITRKQRERNRKNNRLYIYEGKLRCVAELSEKHGIHRNTLQQRLDKDLSIEKSLSIPVRKIKKNNNV
jgi:group I intron endonuclease